MPRSSSLLSTPASCERSLFSSTSTLANGACSRQRVHRESAGERWRRREKVSRGTARAGDVQGEEMNFAVGSLSLRSPRFFSLSRLQTLDHLCFSFDFPSLFHCSIYTIYQSSSPLPSSLSSPPGGTATRGIGGAGAEARRVEASSVDVADADAVRDCSSSAASSLTAATTAAYCPGVCTMPGLRSLSLRTTLRTATARAAAV